MQTAKVSAVFSPTYGYNLSATGKCLALKATVKAGVRPISSILSAASVYALVP